MGGYIDGNVTADLPQPDNPSAVGHLVNHPFAGGFANVFVLPFMWKDVLGPAINSTEVYPIPNKRRSDGSPWYFDATAEEIVRFPRDADHYDGDRASHPPVAGAALCSSRELACGDELLLDYGLKGPPYPAWANGWYVPAASEN